MTNNLVVGPHEKDYLAVALGKKIALDFDEPRARRALEGVLSGPLLPFERNSVEGRAQRYAMAWFAQNLATQYPMLSKEIYDLKRRPTYRNRTIEVPMLFSVEVDGDAPLEDVAEITVEHDDRNRFKIRAKVPEFTFEAKEAYVKALQRTLEMERNAYDDKLLKRILFDNPKIPKPRNAKYTMIWAPDNIEFEDISPPPVDPALILTYAGIPFVTHVWKTEDELDIDHMLREFTESFPEPGARNI